MVMKKKICFVEVNEPVCADCNKSMQFSKDSKKALMFNCANCKNAFKVETSFLDGGKHESEKVYQRSGKKVQVQYIYEVEEKVKEE